MWAEKLGGNDKHVSLVNLTEFCKSHPMSKIARVLYEAEQEALTTLTELVKKKNIETGEELRRAVNEISSGSFVTITDCKLALESVSLERIIQRSPTKEGARFSLLLPSDEKVF